MDLESEGSPTLSLDIFPFSLPKQQSCFIFHTQECIRQLEEESGCRVGVGRGCE